MKNKLLTGLLIMLFVAAQMPKSAVAAPSTLAPESQVGSVSAVRDEATRLPLEQAIQNVKKNLTIPSGLTEFSSSFDSYGDRQRWVLLWTAPDGGEGDFRVEVDATTGEIISLNRWTRPADPSFSKTPALSVQKAQQIGQETLNRLLPAKSPSLKLVSDSNPLALGTYQAPTYSMRWNRIYKGINVAMDNAYMEIDMQTGEIVNYNLNWTYTDLTDPQNVINQDQAEKSFVSQEILKLQYAQPITRGQESSPQLVYGIRHPSNGMLDAFTGQPLNQGGYNYSLENLMKDGGMGSSIAPQAGAAPVLSPDEQKEVDRSARFISQTEAIDIVKKWLPAINDMQLNSASLEKDWRNPNNRYWQFGWGKDSPEPGQSAYVWAQLDAVSGELTGFNLNLPPQKPVSSSDLIDQKTAQSLAESFIKKIAPQRWSEIKLDNLDSLLRPMDLNPPTWSFNYVRLVNGILVPNNGIEISIDAGSKQVTTYRLKWSKENFPSAQGVLDSQRANDLFFQSAPLTLSYAKIPNSKGLKEIMRLVYLPKYKDGFYMLDAKSGAALNTEGKPVTKNPQALVFNDIKGHFGEQEIALLGQAGLLGEYGASFHPNENIKLADLLKAMLTVKEGIYSTMWISDEEVLKRCQVLNWIEKDTPADSNVSREQLAQLMVRFLNIDYLTQVQDIYRVSYLDANKMSPQLQAYVALCWGLGIIKADGKTFNPQHTITRGEAAVALVKTLSIKN
ncbi:S-layer homology domain [Syntrophomonas zehnderi OL-4]|uniref:S-layer homology domain n=1 Tax=Syntrophomonas zehnderi OL-4 TaxID=690567 RepID=A0A0E4C8E1_9FIRM|nr:S-layer homology domain-containing protein [Syntrophomonas zehnderi]CFX44387.1 S-layer homology domain [Syntrophomonas zehnderi OL-4]